MKSKFPKLLIQEDLLDITTLQQLKKISVKEKKSSLQEIEYRQDKKVKQISEIPEEELAKAIHTLLIKEEK